MLESRYQQHVISELERIFPGCLVLKNDESYIQGIPDLLILWRTRWAALEVKKSADEAYQPNQEYYIDLMNSMSYAATIHPDNEMQVLNDLQFAFEIGRSARLP